MGTDFSTKFNNWAQVAAMVLAGIWVAAEFGYFQFLLPQQQPNYLNLNLKLEQKGYSDENGAIAVQANVTCTNTSNKIIKIAAGHLEVWADRIKKTSYDSSEYEKHISNKLEDYEGQTSRYFERIQEDRVFVNRIFSKAIFNPGETSYTSRIFHIPANFYDYLDGNVYILSGPDADKLTIRHIVHQEYVEWILVLKEKGVDVEYPQQSKKFIQVREKEKINKTWTNDVLSLWKTD